jgi:ribosomal protein L11 methyltransferase
MNYIQVNFYFQPLLPTREVLVVELAERGFESFVESETGLIAYIAQKDFSSDLLKNLLPFGEDEMQMSFEILVIEDQNWNEEWEKNFHPIVVEDKCVIRAPFHEMPNNGMLDIIIEPKMSFGTGHHATTYLMVAEMLEMKWHNLRVCDMGTGTGVLAILAMKLGANESWAVDIDEWSVENSKENLERNHVNSTTVLLGGAERIEGEKFDVILANINRNILLRDMAAYTNCLLPGGEILLSGFYETDIHLLEGEAQQRGLKHIGTRAKGEWCLLRFAKDRIAS